MNWISLLLMKESDNPKKRKIIGETHCKLQVNNMKGLIDHIHALGLKAGIYSTPWVTSYFGFCGGSSDFEDGHHPEEFKQNRRKGRYIGTYRFEENDVAQWGIS